LRTRHATKPRPWLAPLLALGLAVSVPARAQAEQGEPGDAVGFTSPFAPLVRRHYYDRLAKSPWRALGLELLLPGAGHVYVGLYGPAAATLGVSLLGAALWITGEVRQQPTLRWTGIGTFAAGRTLGTVGAPIGALLLNAAFRRQLGLVGSY
jgi:hypothetical protein